VIPRGRRAQILGLAREIDAVLAEFLRGPVAGHRGDWSASIQAHSG